MFKIQIPLARGKKQWNTVWNGHAITVTNTWELLLYPNKASSTATLYYDHAKVDSIETLIESSNSYHKYSGTGELKTTISTESGDIHIRAVLGVRDSFRTGCKIYLNDELVGGDIHHRLMDKHYNYID